MEKSTENQNNINPAPAPTPVPPTEPVSPHGNINSVLIVILIIVLAGMSFYIFWLRSSLSRSESRNQLTQESTPTSNVPTETPNIPDINQTESLISGKVFYPINTGDILSYDYVTKETKTWNSYVGSAAKPDYTSVNSLQIIDPSTIGFGRCESLPNNYNCGIYTLDLSSNSATLQKRLDAKDLLLNVAFAAKDTFAYTVSGDADWRFVYEKSGTSSILDSLPKLAFGRGGYIEDSSKIAFSPDKSQVFYIETSSPRSTADFNVYGFNPSINNKFVISDATQPDWLSDNEIVYRNPKTDKGLYIYNLGTKTSSKIVEAPEASYNPHVGNDFKSVVYEVNPAKEIHLYNVATKTDQLLLTQAVTPKWVSPTSIVYGAAAPCPTGGCEVGPGGEVLDITVTVYDTVSKKVLGTVTGLDSTYYVASF